MAIRISGTTGIDMGNTSVSNVDVGALDYNAVNKEYADLKQSKSELAYDVNTSSYIPNTLASGAVIERGSNANGEYVKFADGTMICTYKATVTDQAISSAYVGLFTGARSWTLPHEFIEPPICKGDIIWGTSASWTTLYSSTISRGVFIAVDVSSSPSGTSTKLSFMAIWRWK